MAEEDMVARNDVHRTCHRPATHDIHSDSQRVRRDDTLWQRATDVRFANESFPNSSPRRRMALVVQ